MTTLDLTTRGELLASDQGRMEQTRWIPIGDQGCLSVTYSLHVPADRRAAEAIYRLHQWRRGKTAPAHEPWNDSIGCRRIGRLLTRAKAELMVHPWET